MDPKLESLPKEQLLKKLESDYSEAKPVNDRMVDLAMEIQELTAEVYRRALTGWIPGVKIRKTRLVTGINCSTRPSAETLVALKARIDGFTERGLPIIAVEFETNLNEFRLYTSLEAPKEGV